MFTHKMNILSLIYISSPIRSFALVDFFSIVDGIPAWAV